MRARLLTFSAIVALLWPEPALARALAQEARDVDVRWGRWHVAAPFASSSGIALDEKAPPEEELARCAAGGPGPDLGRTYVGKGDRSVRWEPLGEGLFAGLARIDFADHADGEVANAAAFLYRSIEVEADAENGLEIEVSSGSDDGARVWLNGEVVLDRPLLRGLKPGEDVYRLALRPGVNHLLVKVCQAGGGWAFLLHHPIPDGETARRDAQPAIEAAVERGIAYLLRTQELDGSWREHSGGYREGQTALTLYALLKSGVSPKHHAIQRALAYTEQFEPRKTYPVACRIMALSAMPGLQDDERRERMEPLVDALLEWQLSGFAYPGGAYDLSNTQYAAIALWTAAKSGLRIKTKVWRRIADYALELQSSDGGFPYRPGQASKGSTTVGGVACAVIAYQQLEEAGALRPRDRAKLAVSRDRGLEWLAENFTPHANPVPSGAPDLSWTYYFLYGVERVGALCDVTRLGPHDWYWEGAKALLAGQRKDGQWESAGGAPQTNTSFALLFLRRATAARSGEGAKPRTPSYGGDEPEALVNLRATGDTPLTLWVESFGAGALKSYCWPDEQALRVVAVEYVAAGDVVARVESDATQQAVGERFPARVRFPTPGRRELRVRVTVRPFEGGEAVLESPPVQVDIAEVLDETRLAWATDAARNLLRETKVDARASSQHEAQWAPGKATDGLVGTAWLFAESDTERTIDIDLARPARANTLLLTHALVDVKDPGHNARARTVELWLNTKKKPLVIELASDPRAKTTFELPRTENVRKLRLRVVALEAGTTLPGVGGFAEIELQRR